jgi:hypothetical protein
MIQSSFVFWQRALGRLPILGCEILAAIAGCDGS